MANPIEKLIQKYNPQTTHEYENALQEVIQEIVLVGLAKKQFFNKAAFYGGTALRIFYGLSRYSEDLDFTLFKPDPNFKLKPYFSSIKEALSSFDFEIEVTEVEKNKDRKVESAFLKANTQMHLMKIVAAQELAQRIQKNQLLQIKFEVDVVSPGGYETEVKPLFPPLSGAVTVLKPSSLFAGKMHAILFRRWKQRIKGRDFYDLLWYIGQKIPLKLSYLEQKMKDGGTLAMEEKLTDAMLRDLLLKRLSGIDWENAKLDVVAFLQDRHEVDGWNLDFFKSAIPYLKTED